MNNSPIPGQPSLIPVRDCILVRLDKSAIKEGKYDTRTEGIVVKVPELEYVKIDMIDVQKLLGKRVFFEEYKEGARIRRGSDFYCFIKLEDVRGYEDEQVNP